VFDATGTEQMSLNTSGTYDLIADNLKERGLFDSLRDAIRDKIPPRGSRFDTTQGPLAVAHGKLMGLSPTTYTRHDPMSQLTNWDLALKQAGLSP
jgi:hypothetical protein